MLLVDFRKVKELDSKIGAMHRQLAELYQERSALMDDQEVVSVPAIAASITTFEQTYQTIAKAWERFNIAVPTYKTLKPKLVKAKKIQGIIAREFPELADAMEIILVPPVKHLPLPMAADFRTGQSLTDLPDFINPDVTYAKTEQKWSVVLAYTSPDSLYAGSTERLLDEKSYTMAGYDMRGLGIREYAALTLQKNNLLDTKTWTVLLKNSGKKSTVPYAGYRQGRYRFDMEETDNVLDDDGFRPAIEIK